MRQVEVGDSVSVQNYSKGPKWIPGTIVQETGPLSARSELEHGTVVRRHHDQLVTCPTESFSPGVALPITSPLQLEGVDPEIIMPDVNDAEVAHGDREPPNATMVRNSGPTTPVRRYSARNRTPPPSPTAFLLMDSFPPSCTVLSFRAETLTFFFLVVVCFLACLRTWGRGGESNVESWD